MPTPLVWTDHRDAIIHAMRGEGAAWDRIARVLRVSRWAAIQRGRAIGAPLALPRPPRPPGPDPEQHREPLQAGHPTSWGLITAGTAFAGTDYPWPPLPPVEHDDPLALPPDFADAA